ncbi:MAG: hypothetical protein LBC19_07350, partial [Tannerella sp.]|nr:hypothetical protein [Tannerella sp.]
TGNERNGNDTSGVTQAQIQTQQDSLLKASILQDSLLTIRIQQKEDKLRKVREENADLETKKKQEALIQAQLEAQIKEQTKLYKELNKQAKKRKKIDDKLEDVSHMVAPQDTVNAKNIPQITVPQLQPPNPDDNLPSSQIAALNQIRESLTPDNDGNLILSGNLIAGNNNVIILMDNKANLDEILSTVQRTKELQPAQYRDISACTKDNAAEEKVNITEAYYAIDNQIEKVKKIFTESLFDHTSLGMRASTVGIGLELSTTLSRNLQFRIGYDLIDYRRNVNLKTKDVNLQTAVGISTFPILKTKADFSYRNGHALIDIYPVRKGIFHLTTGIYYGMSKIDVDGQVVHPKMKNPLPLATGQKWPDLNFANYAVAINNGKVKSEMILGNRWKPYLGIGIGRSVPHTRLGFKIELGVLYQGDFVMKQNGKKLIKDETRPDSFINGFNYTRWMNLYPVASLQLIYRIW